MADASPNPQTPRKSGQRSSGVPSPMEAARLSTPGSRLSERAAAFESPSRAAKSLSQGEMPTDPDYEERLRNIALYAEKMLLVDMAAQPAPLDEARIVPFAYLATDPYVLAQTDGDAQVCYHALQVTQNLTVETDGVTGAQWIGANVDGEWPTNATLVARVPYSAAQDPLQVVAALQRFTGQPIMNVKPAAKGDGFADAVTPSVMTPECAPQRASKSPVVEEVTRYWQLHFSCGAAAIAAHKDFSDADSLVLANGAVAEIRWKLTSRAAQSRIDSVFPILGEQRARQRPSIPLSGFILRRPPKYGAQGQPHSSRGRSGRRSQSAGASRARSSATEATRAAAPRNANNNARGGSKQRQNNKRKPQSAAARSRTAQPSERREPLDGDVRQMRAMRRPPQTPPRGMSRAQQEEAGLVPPAPAAQPRPAAFAAQAAPTPPPSQEQSRQPRQPRASLPSANRHASLPPPARTAPKPAGGHNDSTGTTSKPSSPTRTHKPYELTPPQNGEAMPPPPSSSHFDGRRPSGQRQSAGAGNDGAADASFGRYPPESAYGDNGGGGYGYGYAKYDPYFVDPMDPPPQLRDAMHLAPADRAAAFARYYREVEASLRRAAAPSSYDSRPPPAYEGTLDLQRKAEAKAEPAAAAAEASDEDDDEDLTTTGDMSERTRLSRREKKERRLQKAARAEAAARAKAAKAADGDADQQEAAAEDGPEEHRRKTRGTRAGANRRRGPKNKRDTPETQPTVRSSAVAESSNSADTLEPPAATAPGPSPPVTEEVPAAAAGAPSFADLLRERAAAPARKSPVAVQQAAANGAASAGAGSTPNPSPGNSTTSAPTGARARRPNPKPAKVQARLS
uniref:Uncharacterized protein n=1 Tax=Neobodo designis TaxID=312471 RepID=A0A7S1W909_NEODS|mmetsp:Transcript_7692/g.24012  ORF Transcript_7692/g.24012 Transcript_7692/m.24012 type:complete len:851 (+) Transcript_7692:221-2773(+)